MAFNPKEKARYWAGVLYPENMRDDWEDRIGELLQLPYVYCVHDKDTDKAGVLRKVHVHLMVAFPNTTTAKNALGVMSTLSADEKTAISTVESVKGVRFMYEYMIHNTADAKKKGKFQYPETARISGNGFDIGSYEQVSVADKREMLRQLVRVAKDEGFYNFADLNDFVLEMMPAEYFEVLVSNSGYLDRVMNGRYQKLKYGECASTSGGYKVDPETGEVLDEQKEG